MIYEFNAKQNSAKYQRVNYSLAMGSRQSMQRKAEARYLRTNWFYKYSSCRKLLTDNLYMYIYHPRLRTLRIGNLPDNYIVNIEIQTSPFLALSLPHTANNLKKTFCLIFIRQ